MPPALPSTDRSPPLSTWHHEGRWVVALLVAALLHGALYSAIIPLWQMPDEPGHIEYVELLRHEGRLVPPEAENPAVRRAIVRSLWANDFDRFFPGALAPDSLRVESPAIPGVSELLHPPLYYLLGAALLAPFPDDVDLHARLMRLFSVTLSTLTVLVAFLVARELFPGHRWLRLAIPATIVLTPAHAAITASINNDPLAELLVSLFFWWAVRLLRRGWHPVRLVGLALTIALCHATKRTTLIVYPMTACLLLLALWPRLTARGWRRLLFPAGAGLLAIGLVTWELPRVAPGWYTTHGTFVARTSEDARSGAAALLVLPTKTGRGVAAQLIEVVPGMTEAVALRGWVRSRDGPTRGELVVQSGEDVISQPFTATAGWQPISLQSLLTPADILIVKLVAYDQPLVFDDLSLASTTGSLALRNPDAEEGGIDLPLPIYTLINEVLDLRVEGHIVSRLLTSGPTTDNNYRLYWGTALNLFIYYWAGFGVRRVELAPGWYLVLGALVSAGMVGATVALARRRLPGGSPFAPWQWQGLLLFAVAGAVTLLVTVLRLEFADGRWVPHARYLYVAVVPFTTLLAVGLRQWLPARWAGRGLAFWLAFLALLDLVSLLFYVIPYYY